MTTAHAAAVTGHKPNDFRPTTLTDYFQSPPQRRIELTKEFKPRQAMEESALHYVTPKQAGMTFN